MRMMRRKAKVAPYRYCLISSYETFKALCSSSRRLVNEDSISGLFLYITETLNTEINHIQNDCFNFFDMLEPKAFTFIRRCASASFYQPIIVKYCQHLKTKEKNPFRILRFIW